MWIRRVDFYLNIIEIYIYTHIYGGREGRRKGDDLFSYIKNRIWHGMSFKECGNQLFSK